MIGDFFKILDQHQAAPSLYQNNLYVLEGGALFLDGVISLQGFFLDATNNSVAVSLDGGDLNVGASPGVGTINGNLCTEPGSRWVVEIAGNQLEQQYDQLVVNGDAVFNGLIVLKFLDGFAPSQGDVFDFLAVTGDTDLSGATLEVQGLLPGFEYDVQPTATGFQLLALSDGVSVVPEPQTILLTLLGVLGWVRRRSR